jgi:hypothetical protein
MEKTTQEAGRITPPVSLPLGYLAPVEWYAYYLGNKQPEIQIGDTLPRQSIHTRCRIDGPQNTILLSVPVKDKGRVKVSEAQINYQERWIDEHIQALRSSYRNAPFFEYLEDDLVEILQREYPLLMDLNLALHKQILKWLRCNDEVILNDRFENYVPWPKNGAPGQIHIPPYPQVFQKTFTPGLSIIDALSNEGAHIHWSS